MPDSEGMTITERRKYLALMQRRYLQADRVGRGKLLDEMEAVTGLHRKSLVRLLAPGGLRRHARRRQRGREYGVAVDDTVRVVWESLDYVCAERLKPALLPTARLLSRHGELPGLTPELEAHLERISLATLQRRLTRLSQDSPRLPRKGPERANQVARQIPMGRIRWDEAEPGHFEVDLVHHSGPVTSGDYLHTLQLIDVATGWSERVAVLGRSQRAMEAGFRRILERLPFPVVELHPDNGPEFLNAHLVRFWKDKVTGLSLSRSRPYHKNDNRLVEQKNDTLVRAYFGHSRLDTAEQAEAMNRIYDDMWVYYNLFQPVLHLVEKTAVGARVRRRWDEAKTPFERLAATDALAVERRAELEGLRERTNPRLLRRALYAAIEDLFRRRAGASEGAPEGMEPAAVGLAPPSAMAGSTGPASRSVPAVLAAS